LEEMAKELKRQRVQDEVMLERALLWERRRAEKGFLISC
jgi:hypothetical protein